MKKHGVRFSMKLCKDSTMNSSLKNIVHSILIEFFCNSGTQDKLTQNDLCLSIITPDEEPTDFFGIFSRGVEAIHASSAQCFLIAPSDFPIKTLDQLSTYNLESIVVFSATDQELLIPPKNMIPILVPKWVLEKVGNPEPNFLNLMTWELILRILEQDTCPIEIHTVRDYVDSKSTMTLLTAYREYIRQKDTENITNLPETLLESSQLRHTLISTIVTRHRKLFADKISALLASYESEKMLSEERLIEIQSTYRLPMKIWWWGRHMISHLKGFTHKTLSHFFTINKKHTCRQ